MVVEEDPRIGEQVRRRVAEQRDQIRGRRRPVAQRLAGHVQQRRVPVRHAAAATEQHLLRRLEDLPDPVVAPGWDREGVRREGGNQLVEAVPGRRAELDRRAGARGGPPDVDVPPDDLQRVELQRHACLPHRRLGGEDGVRQAVVPGQPLQPADNEPAGQLGHVRVGRPLAGDDHLVHHDGGDHHGELLGHCEGRLTRPDGVRVLVDVLPRRGQDLGHPRGADQVPQRAGRRRGRAQPLADHVQQRDLGTADPPDPQRQPGRERHRVRLHVRDQAVDQEAVPGLEVEPGAGLLVGLPLVVVVAQGEHRQRDRVVDRPVGAGQRLAGAVALAGVPGQALQPGDDELARRRGRAWVGGLLRRADLR